MGWAVGYDSNWKRDIGYGVVAWCDHPKCDKVIDRGLGYVCGYGEPYGGERGCGLYFCSEHGGEFLCPRCRASKPPYKHPKAEHPRWLWWKLNDPSWEQWRNENPKEVASYREQIKRFTPTAADIKATRNSTD